MTLWTEMSEKDQDRGQYSSAPIYFPLRVAPDRAIYVTYLCCRYVFNLPCVTSPRLQLDNSFL
jgi:hypothetical protein